MSTEREAPEYEMTKKLMSVADACHLSRRASHFHDATLSQIHLGRDRLLFLEVTRPWWIAANGPSKLDAATRFCFHLNNFSISECWGSDDEICLSSIIDFAINDGRFELSTGDGGRSGSLSMLTSTMEIITTPAAILEFDLPI